MNSKNQYLQKEILRMIPIRYWLIDKFNINDKKRVSKERVIKNRFYKGEMIFSKDNYRPTSKMLNEE